MVFIFAAFGSGIAAGTGNYATGTVGVATFCVVVAILRVTGFGAMRQYDGILRVRLPAGVEPDTRLRDVMRMHCSRFALVTLREVHSGEDVELAYQLTLKDADAEMKLVHAVSAIPGAEDVAMSWALKREGRFVVLWQHVLTSGRRVRGIRGLQMLAGLVRMAVSPGMLTRRSSVKKIWYESNREDDDRLLDSLTVQLANAVVLLLTIAMITGPLWNLIPGSLTPLSSPLGKIRIGIGIFCCQVGMVAWPCAYFLLRTLLRQRRWVERIKLVVLIVLCLWSAWSSTQVVVWFWAWLVGCDVP
jgi:hypothetical protein